MYKYILESAGNINWMAIFALLTFVAIFLISLLVVIRRGKEYSRKMANMPLEDGGSSLKTVLTLLLIPSSTIFAFAAAPEGEAARDPNYLAHLMEYIVLGIGVVIMIVGIVVIADLVAAMVGAQRRELLAEQGIEEQEVTPVEAEPAWWHKFYKRATNVVPLDQEETILFDHEYDGIRELDNSLPPWWVAMFYITIGFAVVYMGYYHVWGYGLSSGEEYAYEVEQAEKAIKAALARQPDMVDETNVTVVTDDLDLGVGKSIYELNCSVCHGKAGEGLVGPNFADEYWLHGGDIKDLFRVIKYGVPEKGMISWKAQLRPPEIQKVASYILTFQGTNPPNAKAPQGDLYAPGQMTPEESASDSVEVDDRVSGVVN